MLHTVVYTFLLFSKNLYENSISDQRVDYTEFSKLMNNFGRSHREDFGELVEDLKMNRNEREEMKEYVERYVFDVRFQKNLSQSSLNIFNSIH